MVFLLYFNDEWLRKDWIGCCLTLWAVGYLFTLVHDTTIIDVLVSVLRTPARISLLILQFSVPVKMQ